MSSPWLSNFSNLLCIDGRHLCDACNLNHSFRVLSQVQEARGRVQQVTNHLIVDLKRHKLTYKSQINAEVFVSAWQLTVKFLWVLDMNQLGGCLCPLKRLHSDFQASCTDQTWYKNSKCYIFSNLSFRNHSLLGGRLSSTGVSALL